MPVAPAELEAGYQAPASLISPRSCAEERLMRWLLPHMSAERLIALSRRADKAMERLRKAFAQP